MPRSPLQLDPRASALSRALGRRARPRTKATGVAARLAGWAARVAARVGAIAPAVRGQGVQAMAVPAGPAEPEPELTVPDAVVSARPTPPVWLRHEPPAPGEAAVTAREEPAAPDPQPEPDADAWDRLARSSPRVPNQAVAAFLDSLLRPPPGPVRAFDGPAADEIAARHRADAVARGTDVAFRTGAFDLTTPHGAGLFAHEAGHAARGAEPSAAEERRALADEVVVRTALHAEPPAPAAPPPTVAVPPAATVHTAMPDRPLPAAVDRPPAAPGPLTDEQLRQVKDVVYRDLLDRIRVEFERGG